MAKTKNRDIDQYKHQNNSRLNNPQVGMVSGTNDPDGSKKTYSYDPHFDPTLVWSGKEESSELSVNTVSIHVHERVDPKSIIYQVHKNSSNSSTENYQYRLFDQPFDHRPVRDEISFYQHRNSWANRLIAGDSLLVMNSLLEKEGMSRKVQTVFFDPPYGIKYGSNFQPYTNQRKVDDRKDDSLNTEPEMLKAFRDTWELGIHSYLSYLRDRLLLVRELLHSSGSVFVQISDENLHHIRELMDEVFGVSNYMDTIAFATTSGLQGKFLSSVPDYLIWYAKDKTQVKYRKLFTDKVAGGRAGGNYKYLDMPDGTTRAATKKELSTGIFPSGSRIFRSSDLKTSGNPNVEFTYKGKKYSGEWKTNLAGMNRLAEADRILVGRQTLSYKRYLDDFPAANLTNFWTDTGTGGDFKSYVVQTNDKVVERCILMTSDPGDLVLDPTCGSGTTAYTAERWGRRWITMDTSRIAIQLAKQRLITSSYEWFKLAHEDEGISAGFLYNTIPHITLESIAKDEPADEEPLYDQPLIDDTFVRVSGPFTVEAIPSIRVQPLADSDDNETADNSLTRTGETARQDQWRAELLQTGVRTKGGQKVEFVRVELLQGTRYLHAEAETKNGQRVLVSFGPESAPLDPKQVEMALEEASQSKPSPQIILFAAFQFDPEASKDIDETKWSGVELLKVQMNTDLLTHDLKRKQNSNESFWLIGQPDVEITKNDGKYVVRVDGFDYYDPKSGEIQSGGVKEIAMWMIDTDYDGRSLFPTQVFFPLKNAKHSWHKIEKNLKAELDEELLEVFQGTESIPFDSGDYKRCAVKIIDNRGIESLVIKHLD